MLLSYEIENILCFFNRRLEGQILHGTRSRTTFPNFKRLNIHCVTLYVIQSIVYYYEVCERIMKYFSCGLNQLSQIDNWLSMHVHIPMSNNFFHSMWEKLQFLAWFHIVLYFHQLCWPPVMSKIKGLESVRLSQVLTDLPTEISQMCYWLNHVKF